MTGRKRSLSTMLLATLAMLALLLLVNGAGASPLPSDPFLLDEPPAESSALQDDTFWNSGWLDIAPGDLLSVQHNYGGDSDFYAVDVWFRDIDGELGINHKAFGGMEAGGHFSGLAWQKLTSSSIELQRFAHDTFADQVLVRIYVPPPPVWDSDWVDIAPGGVLTLTHNLGGDPEQYTVAMRFLDTDPEGIGVNLRAAGGLEVGEQLYGAAWQMLTATTIQVLRFRDDTVTDRARIQIYHPDPPLYDSGWRNIDPGQELTLVHNLGGNPLTYIVRAFGRDTQPGGRGLNTVYGGGFEANGHFFGSNWQKLNNVSISAYRYAHDDMAHTSDQVRVWIYAPTYRVWLPTVMRDSL